MIPNNLNVRPDWSMVGFRISPELVAILASDKLIDGQMMSETDYETITDGWSTRTFAGPTITTVEYRMTQYVIFTAPTYAEAFRAMADFWGPHLDEERTPIEGRQSLPPARATAIEMGS